MSSEEFFTKSYNVKDLLRLIKRTVHTSPLTDNEKGGKNGALPGLDGSLKMLEDNCAETGSAVNWAGAAAYCTALIQYHGWKIPKNYPKTIKY